MSSSVGICFVDFVHLWSRSASGVDVKAGGIGGRGRGQANLLLLYKVWPHH